MRGEAPVAPAAGGQGMRIEFTGRQVEVPGALRARAEKKLRKLERVLRGITRAHVILSTDRHRQVVEVSVHSPHFDLTATEGSADFGASLSTVMDRLLRQAQRHTGKLRGRKRRAPGRTAAPAPPRGRGERPRVIRSRRFAVKPMTVDEAVLEVGAAEDGLVVFRDARTERVNVLYRRKDGNLGLIEPEA